MLGHLERMVGGLQGGALDRETVRRLADLQSRSAQRNLRQTGQLLRILSTLHEAGVEAMPFKGPAWAQRLYGNITLRGWADLDVLVPQGQVQKARGALLANGLVDSDPLNARLAANAQGGWGQVALSATERGVHLELHWQVAPGMRAPYLRPEEILGRAARLDLLGRSVPTPSKQDMLLMTCLNGARDRWNLVEMLLGLAVQVRDTPDGEWPGILHAARTARCARRVVVGVVHVCRALGLEVPKAVADALAHNSPARALLRSLRPDSLGRELGVNPRHDLSLLLWRFATEDSIIAGMGRAVSRLFSPGPEDWRSFALPSWALWFHYLLRPPRLAAKWLGWLLGVARVRR
jgi:hypothetical protein